jgi:hypothetical protein
VSGIYYSPESNGAEILGSVDTIGGYEFNMLAVFRRKSDGALFFESDSGCSCYSPFEGASFENMQHIRNASWFAGQARKWLRKSYEPSADDRDGIERLIRIVGESL